jgi:hypothetical protein
MLWTGADVGHLGLRIVETQKPPLCIPVEMMMPVPKCFTAKKMLEKNGVWASLEATIGKKTPMDDEANMICVA